MKTLDTEAVHAFVLTAELKSFTRAAEAMGTTQSAVSLKIKRLEDTLGHRLLERTPRRVRLSGDGQSFLAAAKGLVSAHNDALSAFDQGQQRLAVGISHHIVGAKLPALLKHVLDAQPGIKFELRVANSWDILAAYDKGNIDVAIVLKHDNTRRDGRLIQRESFKWFAMPDFQHGTDEPLPLATQSPPCSVRNLVIETLQSAKVDWTEVFVGGESASVSAAVSAGLAVAALSQRVAPIGSVDVGATFSLPQLPPLEIMLYSNLTGHAARDMVPALIAATRVANE